MSLIGILRSGDGIGFLKKIESLVEEFFTHDIESVIEDFIHQFTTDFGKAALTTAAEVASQVVSGQLTIGDGAAQVIEKLGTLGIQTATQDAKAVVLNAIRIHMEVIKAAP